MSGFWSLHHFGFSAPAYLVALVAVPLLLGFVAVIRRRRSRYTVAFTNLEILARVVARRRGRIRRRVPLILLALALATTAAALARPRVQLVGSNRGATIILVADVSGSMQSSDIHPERIYAAVKAMRALVDELPANDKVGLVTFSDKVQVIDAPTTDHAAVESGLDVLRPEGGTALGDGVAAGIKLAVSSLALVGTRHTLGSYLPAAIVLESDGAQNRGAITPLAAAKLAKATGVRIYGVALGTLHGYVLEGSGLLSRSIPVPPDPGTVALLARESGGEAFDATSADRLNTIYTQLGSSIGRHPELTEITSWFELAAAFMLVAGVAAARIEGANLP